MSEMRYFSNEFSKIVPKRWGWRAPSAP